MSFFGMGRPKLSSDEKIAMAEQEMRLLADMHNRYVTIDNPPFLGNTLSKHSSLLKPQSEADA